MLAIGHSCALRWINAFRAVCKHGAICDGLFCYCCWPQQSNISFGRNSWTSWQVLGIYSAGPDATVADLAFRGPLLGQESSHSNGFSSPSNGSGSHSKSSTKKTKIIIATSARELATEMWEDADRQSSIRSMQLWSNEDGTNMREEIDKGVSEKKAVGDTCKNGMNLKQNITATATASVWIVEGTKESRQTHERCERKERECQKPKRIARSVKARVKRLGCEAETGQKGVKHQEDRSTETNEAFPSGLWGWVAIERNPPKVRIRSIGKTIASKRLHADKQRSENQKATKYPSPSRSGQEKLYRQWDVTSRTTTTSQRIASEDDVKWNREDMQQTATLASESTKCKPGC